jgi:enoyl-CoA hydratase
MVVFGERVDGPRAAEIGLAWSCHPDAELIERAVAFAARAAAVPKELAAATLGTLREAPWQPDFDAAVATEIERQTWSMGMGWFRP